ncbi:hypothetical protein DV736_g4670, partial [Chaetothyriales sp. CBS 134916]
MKRSENPPKLSNSLEHCLLKGVLNVVSSVPQGRQALHSPSKTLPYSRRTSPTSSTPLIPTHPELDDSLTPKLVILSQDGRLMQYSLGHNINQPPDQVLRLGPSSTAAAREGVDSKHWLLSIVSRGSHAPSRSRSLSRTGWSRKLSLKADSKRHMSKMLLVFDNICMLEEWLTIIRKAIEAASGVPYLLGLVSQSSQAERNWLDLVTMPFKPPPSNVSGRDAACPSRGSTSTSLSSYHDVEWSPSTKHASSGSGSSVYTNTELDDMRQSRSSSYSSAQASSQSSLGNSDELALRQQKPTPNLPQAPDAGESLSRQDAPQTLDLQAIAAPPDARRRSISCSPKFLIPPSERTPTLAPEAVHLMTGNQPLGDELHSPDESVRAATMKDWLDNAKVEALKPEADHSTLESMTPSSAIFRDFEFSWGETGVASGEASRVDDARCYPSSPTIHVVPDSEHDVHTKSADSGSIGTSILTTPSFNAESQFTTLPGLLSAALKSPILEFSPTLAAFPQPATWQPVQRSNDDKFSDGGSKPSHRPMTPPSLSRAKPRTAHEAPKDAADFYVSWSPSGRPSATGVSTPHPGQQSLSQRSSTQNPLPPAEAIAELALQLSILTSGPAAPDAQGNTVSGD